LGNVLDAKLIFTSIALFNLLKMPLYLLPIVISKCIDGKSACTNIDEFLNHFDIPNLVRTYDSKASIKIRDVILILFYFI